MFWLSPSKSLLVVAGRFRLYPKPLASTSSTWLPKPCWVCLSVPLRSICLTSSMSISSLPCSPSPGCKELILFSAWKWLQLVCFFACLHDLFLHMTAGEVSCFGIDKYEAFLKSLMATGFKMPKNKTVLVSLGPLHSKLEFLSSARELIRQGSFGCFEFSVLFLLFFPFFRCQGSLFSRHLELLRFFARAKFLSQFSINRLQTSIQVSFFRSFCLFLEDCGFLLTEILDYFRENRIDLVINIPESGNSREMTDGYLFFPLSQLLLS